MLIVCPSCASEYTLDPTKIGADGRTVRCAACRSTWFVAPEADGFEAERYFLSDPGEDLAGGPAISVDARTGRRPAADFDPPKSETPSPEARRPSAQGRIGAAAAALCLALAAAAIVSRAQIVEALPETARLYAMIRLPVNLRGLDFRSTRSEVMGSGNDALLVVEGEIANVTSGAVSVPPIEIALRDGQGHALYTWTNDPPRQTLEAAETARFRARLASPPAESRQVLVRFAPAGTAAHRSP